MSKSLYVDDVDVVVNLKFDVDVIFDLFTV
jgi:hypothetical protein